MYGELSIVMRYCLVSVVMGRCLYIIGEINSDMVIRELFSVVAACFMLSVYNEK